MMAPLVRRTWAPRGETPNLLESSGIGPREKVSVAAALWLTPLRDQLGLYFQTLVNDFFNPWNVAAFLEALLVAVPGRVVVVWDGGPMHKGDPIRQTQEVYSDRITLERLPPYAPMLNPVEPLWSWLKYGRLSVCVHDKLPTPGMSLDARAKILTQYPDRLPCGSKPPGV